MWPIPSWKSPTHFPQQPGAEPFGMRWGTEGWGSPWQPEAPSLHAQGGTWGSRRGGLGALTSSASLSSFSSVSSPFSCWSFALFLKASFSGLPRSEGDTRLGDRTCPSMRPGCPLGEECPSACAWAGWRSSSSWPCVHPRTLHPPSPWGSDSRGESQVGSTPRPASLLRDSPGKPGQYPPAGRWGEALTSSSAA